MFTTNTQTSIGYVNIMTKIAIYKIFWKAAVQALVNGFREDFYVFPIISEWEIMTSPVCGLFGPQRHGRQDL